MTSNGREYEAFVASLQKALFDSEQWLELKNIEIELNKRLFDRCGIEREFDLYWEYELAGVTYKTVVECKDYASTISIDKIDALVGKIQDIPDLKALFATKKGYQSGAKVKAQQHSIDLLVVRESNDSDWTLDDGTPCIREVCASVIVILPARIKSFTPKIDVKWAKANIDAVQQGNKELNVRTDQTFIEDIAKGDRYSLVTLEERLGQGSEDDFGEREFTQHFEEAYLVIDNRRMKLKSVHVSYYMPKPIKNEIYIDGSKELLGVIEYLNRNKKTAIFRSRVVKGW